MSTILRPPRKKILTSSLNKDTVEDYEAFVSKYSKILHPTHVLNIKIKSKLCTFYGKLAGYTMTELSKNRSLVDKKLKYCKESLSSIEKIECGLSSLKGEFHSYLYFKTKFGPEILVGSGNVDFWNKCTLIL